MANLKMHMNVLVLFVGILIQITYCCGNTCLPQKHAALFVFGDSLFDAGINNYLNPSYPGNKANYPPYGSTFFCYPSGRFSDGRVIPDFIGMLSVFQPCFFSILIFSFVNIKRINCVLKFLQLSMPSCH